MAIAAKDTVVYWSTSTAFSTAVSVSQVNSVNGFSGSANMIDITNLASSMIERIPGLPDLGNVTISFTYDSSDAGQTALRTDWLAQTKRRLGVKIPTNTSAVWHSDAYVSGYSLTHDTNEVIRGNVTFSLTGGLTWTTQ